MSKKIKLSLKSDKNSRYFTLKPISICNISLNSSSNEKYSDKLFLRFVDRAS